MRSYAFVVKSIYKYIHVYMPCSLPLLEEWEKWKNPDGDQVDNAWRAVDSFTTAMRASRDARKLDLSEEAKHGGFVRDGEVSYERKSSAHIGRTWGANSAAGHV